MHIPDGFFDAPTALAAGAAAVAGLTIAARKAAVDLEDRSVPLAGLVAAFVFAVQMLNFPVAAGTSGHLIGAALAAVLVGPWTGALCIAVVVGVQTLFADGGLTALGLNIVNMALVGSLVGYGVFNLVHRVLPRTRSTVALASGIAAWTSVVAASSAFGLEYFMGGLGGASPATVLAAMTGVHALIGIGEAFITAVAVSMVMGVRPDLVHGAASGAMEWRLRSALEGGVRR